MAHSNSITASMIWKTLERYSVLGSQMLIQIIIARLVTPDEYGLVSIMTVFISVATVFIQNGFNMALVHKKDATEKDVSTAFVINLSLGLVMYIILFLFAPLISSYYKDPQIELCLRVLGLILIIGSVNSIQIAIATKNMNFRVLFIGNLVGSVVSGVMGIICAYCGLGVWALVVQQLLNKIVVTVALAFMLKWIPQFTVCWESAVSMFLYGWKLLVAGLINQIYNELNTLVIGRKYSSSDLAYYNKGKQFPYYITTGIDSSVQSVMFSAFSKKQSDIKALHDLLRKSISVNTYIIFPLMVGLVLTAEPLTVLLLTEKWLPIVPFMQICCLKYALHPIESAHLQAIAAIGRSDIRLKLEFIKKPIGIILLIIAITHGPFAIAISAVLTGVIGFFVNVFASRMVVKLSFKEQLLDIMPTVIASCLMGVCVLLLSSIPLSYFWKLIVQILLGVVIYIAISVIIKPFGFKYILSLLNRLTKKGGL